MFLQSAVPKSAESRTGGSSLRNEFSSEGQFPESWVFSEGRAIIPVLFSIRTCSCFTERSLLHSSETTFCTGLDCEVEVKLVFFFFKYINIYGLSVMQPCSFLRAHLVSDLNMWARPLQFKFYQRNIEQLLDILWTVNSQILVTMQKASSLH